MFIFGGTRNYFGGTSRFRGTQVEKHWSRLKCNFLFQKLSNDVRWLLKFGFDILLYPYIVFKGSGSIPGQHYLILIGQCSRCQYEKTKNKNKEGTIVQTVWINFFGLTLDTSHLHTLLNWWPVFCVCYLLVSGFLVKKVILLFIRNMSDGKEKTFLDF